MRGARAAGPEHGQARVSAVIYQPLTKAEQDQQRRDLEARNAARVQAGDPCHHCQQQAGYFTERHPDFWGELMAMTFCSACGVWM